MCCFNNFGGRGCGCGNRGGCEKNCGGCERNCGCDKGHGGMNNMSCTKTVLPVTITSCIKAECGESCY